jgi:DNA-directed RNA polymerase specialized sigma24 family protein
MVQARAPTSGELFEIMRGSDPEAATRAFQKFLVTPDEWWLGDNPVTWARRVAKRRVAQMSRQNKPVHQLDGTDWIANKALLLLARDAPKVQSVPPAFLINTIRNIAEWALGKKRRNGEPWAFDSEEAFGWMTAPDSSFVAPDMWDDKTFCERVARRLNSLSGTLRPYAILSLLESLRPVEIAKILKVKEDTARQNCRRAVQALVGRKDGPQLVGLETTRTIRQALALPDGVFIAERDAAEARQREEEERIKATKIPAKAMTRSKKGGAPRKV